MEAKKKYNAKRFIGIFIDNLVRKFRCDNKDYFTLQINGLGCFIENDDIVLFLINNMIILFIVSFHFILSFGCLI